MKSTGIVRKIDELGRIVLPKELRDSFGIEEKDPLEIFTEGQRIILEPLRLQQCVFCGNADVNRLIEHRGVRLCRVCQTELKVRPDHERR